MNSTQRNAVGLALPAVAGQLKQSRLAGSWQFVVLALGVGALVLPTLRGIAAESWSSEQGAHGPIVLAIAIWLFFRAWPSIRANAAPGSLIGGGVTLVAMLCAYTLAHIVGSIMLESSAAYGALLASLYMFVGWRAMAVVWFPIAYFVFVVPLPGGVVATLTQPLRLYISQFAVSTLALVGYPVARTGLEIYVGQYVLEVRAACGGLNSIISLSAIGLFYTYVRHNANVRYSLLFLFVVVAMAIVANLVRVVLIILITYYLGDQAGQGFLHQFAGMTMFVVAMGGVILFDQMSTPLRRVLASTR